MSKHILMLAGGLGAMLAFLSAPVVRSTAQAAAKPEIVDTRTADQKEIDRLLEEARLAYRKSDFSAARAAYQAAREKAEAIKDDRRLATGLYGVALVQRATGQAAKALELHLQALAIREAIHSLPGIGASLTSIGLIYSDMGEADKSREALERALDIYRQLGDETNIAGALNNLGIYYVRIGQMEKALEYYQQSLVLKEKLGDLASIVSTINNLGSLYAELGQTEQALDYHHRALALKEKLGNPASIAHTLNNMGICYNNLGDTARAIECHQKALAIREKIDNPSDVAESLDNLGNVYIVLSQWDRALQYQQKALAIREKFDNPGDVARSLNNLGSIYPEIGKPEIGLTYCRRAQALWEKTGPPLAVAFSLANIGSIYMRMHRTEEALANNLRAIEIMETAGLQVDDPAELGNFQMVNLGNLYAATANLISEKQPGAALAMLERGRAQGLARQIEGAAFLDRLLTPQDRAQLQQKETALGRAASALRDTSRLPVPVDAAKKAEYERSLKNAQQSYSDAQFALLRFRSDLFAQPRYADLRRLSGTQPPNSPELLTLSKRHPGTLYLEFAHLDDRSLLRMALQGGRLHIDRLICDTKQLQKWIRDWRGEIVRGDAYDRPREEQLAHLLYETLLGGLGMDAARQMVIVAEKDLLDIPFAALRDAQHRRLVERCGVSSAFSLASLTWPTTEGRASESLLCMADPIGKNGDTYQSASRGAFGPLPRAREEGKAIAALVPGSHILVGPEAREAEVKAEMARYDMLHFATHAVADGRHGLLSALILAPEPLSAPEDGVLLAEEITGMSLKARLVVLSACETARGQVSGGEGLLGLGWAFRAAGVPAVVASQWRVDDSATEALMVHFYRGIRAGQAKDAALRAAMLAVKQTKPNPFFWGAFEIIGDCSPLSNSH